MHRLAGAPYVGPKPGDAAPAHPLTLLGAALSTQRATHKSAEEAAMAKGRMDLSAIVGKLLAADEPDVLREGVRVLAQAVMETEVMAPVGAEAYVRDVSTRKGAGVSPACAW